MLIFSPFSLLPITLTMLSILLFVYLPRNPFSHIYPYFLCYFPSLVIRSIFLHSFNFFPFLLIFFNNRFFIDRFVDAVNGGGRSIVDGGGRSLVDGGGRSIVGGGGKSIVDGGGRSK